MARSVQQTWRFGPRARVALVLGSALAVLVFLQVGTARAESLDSKLHAKQTQLDQVRGKRGVLTTAISHYSNQIGLLEGQVAALRNREAAVQTLLVAKQAQLDRAVAKLEKEKGHLQVLRAHLKRSLVALRQRLVSTYMTGTPNLLTDGP